MGLVLFLPCVAAYTIPLAHGGRLSVGDRTLIVGVINVTPDSFSDGGRLFDPKQAVEAGLRMADEGADLIDIGGESTRPGADPIDETEEQRRVVPVIEGLAAGAGVPISVDTYRASTAAAALKAGAALVNDMSGLRYDPALGGRRCHERAAIVLMHTRGRSRDMYQQASYHDVIGEVLDELRQSLAFAASAGIQSDHIIVDPGLGFAKEAAHSYEVLAGLSDSQSSVALAGWSLAKVVPREAARRPGAPAERDWATAAAVTAAVLAGAHIVRVHAVREMLQVVRVADELGDIMTILPMSWLTELLRRPAIAWWDLLDIAIVSIMVHELLLLIRGTRAVQMALSGGFLNRIVLPVPVAAARNRQLGDSKPRRGMWSSPSSCSFRPISGAPRALRPRARSFAISSAQAPTRRSRSWSRRPQIWPHAASARSS